MKKIQLILAGLALTAISFSLTSCGDDKDSDAVTVANGTATVTGRVQADLNTTKTGLESVPAGTKIIAKINTGDLVVQKSGSYADKLYPVEVAADGTYKVTVDANAQNVTVTIMPQDFTYDATVPDPTPAAPNNTKTERKVYHASSQTTTVVNGSSKIVDIDYGF